MPQSGRSGQRATDQGVTFGFGLTLALSRQRERVLMIFFPSRLGSTGFGRDETVMGNESTYFLNHVMTIPLVKYSTKRDIKKRGKRSEGDRLTQDVFRYILITMDPGERWRSFIPGDLLARDSDRGGMKLFCSAVPLRKMARCTP
jgi:hypothetical protein